MSKRPPAVKNPLNPDRLKREAQRQAEAAWVRTPLGREVYRWTSRWRSGALTRPRVIIGAVGSLVVLIAFGCLTCGGVIAAWVGLR
jgi:hypothetical protein